MNNRYIAVFLVCLLLKTSLFAEEAHITSPQHKKAKKNFIIEDNIEDEITQLRQSNSQYVTKLAGKAHNVYTKKQALIFTDVSGETTPETLFPGEKNRFIIVRNPGLIVNQDVIDGIEQNVQLSFIPLLIVMGHTDDQLMIQACKGFHDKHAPALIGKLQSSVQAARQDLPQMKCTDESMANTIAKYNMLSSINQIMRNSPLLRKLVKQHELKVFGAMLNSKTGEVTFFDSGDL